MATGQDSELKKAAREALWRAAVALVVAVLMPVPMWAKTTFFTVLFVAGIVIRARKVRGSVSSILSPAEAGSLSS